MTVELLGTQSWLQENLLPPIAHAHPDCQKYHKSKKCPDKNALHVEKLFLGHSSHVAPNPKRNISNSRTAVWYVEHQYTPTYFPSYAGQRRKKANKNDWKLIAFLCFVFFLCGVTPIPNIQVAILNFEPVLFLCKKYILLYFLTNDRKLMTWRAHDRQCKVALCLAVHPGPGCEVTAGKPLIWPSRSVNLYRSYRTVECQRKLESGARVSSQ